MFLLLGARNGRLWQGFCDGCSYFLGQEMEGYSKGSVMDVPTSRSKKWKAMARVLWWMFLLLGARNGRLRKRFCDGCSYFLEQEMEGYGKGSVVDVPTSWSKKWKATEKVL